MHARAFSKLKAVAKPSLSAMAGGQLRRLIVTGALPPGEKLVEEDIASRLQMSRTPVRDALVQMEAEGLAVKSGRRGLEVSALSVEEIDQIYPMIAAIEKLAFLDCPAPARDKLRKLKQANLQFQNARGRLDAMIKADRAWHAALTQDTRNLLALDMLEPLKSLSERYERAYLGQQDLGLRSVHEHADIIAALENGDVSMAAKALEAHWLNSRNALYKAVTAR